MTGQRLGYFLLIFVVYINLCIAQPSVQWDKAYGGTSNDYLHKVVQTPDSGFVLVGVTQSTDKNVTSIKEVNGNNNYGGGGDAWFVKLGKDGEIEWHNILGGTSYDILRDVTFTFDNGYVLVGSTSSNDGEVLSSTDVDNVIGGGAWIIKLDATGNIVWHNVIGGTSASSLLKVIRSADGGYVAVGWTNATDGDASTVKEADGSGNHGMSDAWVVKFNAIGEIEWHNQLGGSENDKANAVFQSTDNGYVIVGWTQSSDGDVLASTDVDGSGNHNNSRDIWVLKLNASGILEWQNTIGGSNVEEANDVLITDGNGIVLTGLTNSTDGDALASTDIDGSGNHGERDVWIIKLDENGNILWHNIIGGTATGIASDQGDYANSIAPMCNGGFLLSGESYTRTVNGDKTEPNPSNCFEALWMLRLDANGYILWDKTIGSGYNGYHEEEGKAFPTLDNGYLLYGQSANDIGNDKTAPIIGNWDFWLIKLEYEVVADFNSGFTCGNIPYQFENTSQIDTMYPDYDFLWNFNDPLSNDTISVLEDPTHIYTKAGGYDVQLILNKDCKTDTVHKTIWVEVPTIFTQDTIRLCELDTTELDAENQGSFYLWSTGDTIQIISVDTFGSYWVEVTTVNTCKNKDSISIKKECYIPNSLFIPNIFSPNADGRNDRFKVEGINLETIELSIYTKLGEKVFESSTTVQSWDGMFEGMLAAEGVYVYHLKAGFSDGFILIRTGNFTLLR